MTKRIFKSIFTVAAVILISCLVIIMGVLYSYFTSVQRDTLASQTGLVASGADMADSAVEHLEALDTGDVRITLVASDGVVLYDSSVDAAQMENHAEREEIKEALEHGAGNSERTSKTLTQRTLYHAELLSDGSVLRLSATQNSVLTLALGMLQPLCVVIAAAIVFSAVLAYRLSRRIVEPLNALDLENPLDNETYDELAPLLIRIERQHRQISVQLAQMQKRQQEFSTVTQSMKEGLTLLNDDGVILSMNIAAKKLLNVNEDCIGRHILSVDRSNTMKRLVANAQNGRHGETVMELHGGKYQVNASPVMGEDGIAGVCILAFDITAKAEAEQRRREFSANVSHELKTPLQSIMGSAELIESGLVKPCDMPRFVGHIRAESVRLVSLIDDIMRLSQLDEGIDVHMENCDLYDIADGCSRSLREKARERGVTLTLDGESAKVYGVPRVLSEIIYNLADNAIKYNVDGGSVEIKVNQHGEGATLSVKDSGIGIPEGEQERVFERFYRVDKSRSREIGGTGLGLSIVKHGAQLHGASIELISKQDKGTEVILRFPRHKQ